MLFNAQWRMDTVKFWPTPGICKFCKEGMPEGYDQSHLCKVSIRFWILADEQCGICDYCKEDLQSVQVIPIAKAIRAFKAKWFCLQLGPSVEQARPSSTWSVSTAGSRSPSCTRTTTPWWGSRRSSTSRQRWVQKLFFKRLANPSLFLLIFVFSFR